MMIDREKVISAYECVITRGKSVCECEKCDYHIDYSTVFFCDSPRVLTDVLAMLKEQDAVKPKTEHAIYDKGWWWYVCGSCGENVDRRFKYCPSCGRQVKWE